MIKSLISSALVAGGMLASAGAQAVVVNVGGVTWDTDAVTSAPVETDFTAHGSVLEQALNSAAIGTSVSGFGLINSFNSSITNTSQFCPSGCELTFTFSMTLASLNPVVGIPGAATFTFDNLFIDVWLDNLGAGGSAATAYNGTEGSAQNGVKWLELSLTPGQVLGGLGLNIGSTTGSDSGTGSALVDVTGGIAAAYFNTDSMDFGADLLFSSSFNPLADSFDPVTGRSLLTGTFNLSGNSVNVVSEPGSLALLGLGLVGLAGLRRRKL